MEMGANFHGLITGFPRTSRQHDFIMVVVDIMRKLVQFIVVNYTN